MTPPPPYKLKIYKKTYFLANLQDIYFLWGTSKVSQFVVSGDHMLISILSMSVEVLEMSCAEARDALPPWAWDLKPKDFNMM